MNNGVRYRRPEASPALHTCNARPSRHHAERETSLTLLSRLRALSAALALSFAATHAVAADLVIAGRDDIYGKGLADAVAGFNKLHPGTEIELLKLPNANLYQKLKLSMREGTGAYDLVMMDDTWAPNSSATAG